MARPSRRIEATKRSRRVGSRIGCTRTVIEAPGAAYTAPLSSGRQCSRPSMAAASSSSSATAEPYADLACH
jgi:hypothetical protein